VVQLTPTERRDAAEHRHSATTNDPVDLAVMTADGSKRIVSCIPIWRACSVLEHGGYEAEISGNAVVTIAHQLDG
jgi:hypothetical protein